MDLSPFKLDIDELLDEFVEAEFVKLADFKRIWMAKKFSYIYEARSTSHPAFFMQSLYSHSIGYMVSEGALSRRLGGLYCLYCLYETQPYKSFFKIYLSLGELKRLRNLVVDAKENGIAILPALVKRMLDKHMFLFGFVDLLGGTVTQRIDEMTKLQDKRAQIAYDKLFASTHIKDYLNMDLGVEMELETLQKTSKEYEQTKELAIKEASKKVEVEDIKHIIESKKMASTVVEEVMKEWDTQKEQFYIQTGISRGNEIVAADEFVELEELLRE